MKEFGTRLLRHWGFAIFVIDVVASLLMLLKRGPVGHYLSFTAPALALWNGQDPYEVNYPGGAGAYVYTPGCALFFYKVFTFLPGGWGQLLYMSFSVAVFCGGLAYLLRALNRTLGLNLRESSYRHLFWLMVASEAIGGIVAVKLEVLMTGILCWAVGTLVEQKRAWPALFCLGLVTSWKMLMLPIFGLIFIALLASNFKKAVRAGLLFSAGIFTGLVTPFLVLPSAFVWGLFRHYALAMNRFISEGWLDEIFQHLYGFVVRTFPVRLELATANRITLVFGLCLALFVFLASLRLFQNRTSLEANALSQIGAVGLGSAFVVMFAQLIQSNSYIIYMPLPLALMVFAESLQWRKGLVIGVLTLAFVTVSLVYSDLAPRPLYHLLYNSGVKPLGVLVLFIPLVVGYWRGGKTLSFSQPS